MPAEDRCLYIKIMVINDSLAWLFALITAHILLNYSAISPSSGEDT